MEQTQIPTITLDLKKKRIRIHKQTLHQLNDPGFIQFLVHPEKKMIAIKACRRKSRLAHKVNYNPDVDCDFYSRELLRQLCIVNPEMEDGNTYRLSGQIDKNKEIALFPMKKPLIVHELHKETPRYKG